MSLSARRAWIEMSVVGSECSQSLVALRKESVDRNIPFRVLLPGFGSRSPQGERG